MLIEQRDEQWWYKLNGLARHAIARGATNLISDPVVLTEYPKSGGTWLSQMMSAALAIPYPRNRLPHLGSQIIHGCYLTVSPNVDTVVVWRDGRDTMVSYYYHIMFDKPITSAKFGAKLKKKLEVTDPKNITEVMPRFIEWAFEGGYPGYSWADFVNHWHGHQGVAFTSYEAVTENPLRELRKVLDFFGRRTYTDDELKLIVDSFSFQKQTNRKPGEEDPYSFVRKGIVGDWKNVFDAECRQVFHHYAGRELVLLGYETDDRWV
jgi:Sulfotransferase domain